MGAIGAAGGVGAAVGETGIGGFAAGGSIFTGAAGGAAGGEGGADFFERRPQLPNRNATRNNGIENLFDIISPLF